MEYLACSQCFQDRGLCLDAETIGICDAVACPNCGSTNGHRLTRDQLEILAHSFFVWGSILRCSYGAAPRIQFNEHQKTSIEVPAWLSMDLRLFEEKLGVGFFHYGPRLWMVGEVEPLKALQKPKSRAVIIDRILDEYPAYNLDEGKDFYRIRKEPKAPEQPLEYDSSPTPGRGRLDSSGFHVLYGSPDLQVCIHECRVTAEDDLYVATLSPIDSLRLLDLSALLIEDATEFESLDMAVHMLFLAGRHSYGMTRSIAKAALAAGFDGLVYPSYFSILRIGAMPFETAYGISYRRFPQMREYEQAKTLPNLALFGRPIENGKVQVKCINRLVLSQVEYGVRFGPVIS